MTDRKAVVFSTDLASLAAFDPRALAHRIRHPSSWWRRPSPLEVDEVRDGRAAIWPIGGEGTFATRLALASEAPLSDEEKALERGHVAGLGLVVESGDVFVGAAERVPGDGLGDRIVALPGIGTFAKVPPGVYLATVHVLDVRSDARWFDDEGERRPDAPADFVVLLEPRQGPLTPPSTLPALLDLIPREKPRQAPVRIVRREEPSRAEPRRAPRSSPVGGVGERAARLEPEPVPEPSPATTGPLEGGLVKRAMREVMEARAALAPAPGSSKGTLVLKPRDPALQSKDVPVEELYAKVLRCRDQLRVLEQRVNAHDTLPDEAKLDLHVQITVAYEALHALLATTFSPGAK
jgi:hypothetical protein